MLHFRNIVSLGLSTAVLGLAACSSAPSQSSVSDSLSLSLSPASITLTPGATASVAATVARSTGNSQSVTLSVAGVPGGVTVYLTQPGVGSSGTVQVTSSAAATAGAFTITVSATDGAATATAPIATTLNAADAITLVPASTAIIAGQDATPVADAITVTHSFGNNNAVILSASGLPTGLNAAITQPGTGTTGTITFNATTGAPAAPGKYTIAIGATDGLVTASTIISVTVAVVLTVANATDTTIGLSGHLQQFMSTNVLPNPVNLSFFVTYPSTATLAGLNSEHIRIQPVQAVIPQSANTGAASDWSFTALDDTVQLMLNVDDDSPLFQIAEAPPFLNDTSGHFISNPANLALLATYAQNLVRYYNTGGFTYGGTHFQSPSTHHITYWEIWNEPNINNLTAAQYVTLYNTVVPAMLAVDPTIKIVAVSLADFLGGSPTYQSSSYLPTLVQPAASGGLNAQVDAVSLHLYGTCHYNATDASLFTGVPGFANELNYFHAEFAQRSDLATIPIWVDENNVNSDYPVANNADGCTPTIQYMLDPRTTSPFFTAYRPLTFSMLGKVGNKGLYHYSFESNAAYGEVLTSNDTTTIAYWTDYWLQRTFPWNGTATGSLLYKTTTTETTPTVDIMAVLNADSSVSLMVTNYATATTADVNGAGTARTVVVNLSALGTFRTGTEVDLNASTSITTGPPSNAITPAGVLTLTFSGYGSSMFVLKP